MASGWRPLCCQQKDNNLGAHDAGPVAQLDAEGLSHVCSSETSATQTFPNPDIRLSSRFALYFAVLDI